MQIGRRGLLAGIALGAFAVRDNAWATDESGLRYANWPDNPNNLAPTPEKWVNSYNNYYEFGTSKSDPAANAGDFTSEPWSLIVDGLVENPVKLSIEDILNAFALEQRLYRFRCVEAWSMVVPWDGFPLRRLLERVRPTPQARYVAFESVYRPEQMIGQKDGAFGIQWPYREGLRLDEAMNDLTLLAVGSFGKKLSNQCGAPIRLVVPWKYGFKSAKAIVRITLTDTLPETTWNKMAPEEYGFYANVNPDVDHPRWSQASERVIGSESLFGIETRPTLPFNGYEKEVGGLYKNLDLTRNF